MKKCVRIALAQINPTVGDLEGNCRKIKDNIEQAQLAGADIVVFPELALTGYPPEDLLLKPKFIQDNLAAFNDLVKSVGNIVAVIGFVDKKGDKLYNAVGIIYKGKKFGVYHKMLLPNYGVFDEKRYFSAGNHPLTFKLGELCFAVNICEDVWHGDGPTFRQSKAGAQVILNINASPYHMGKIKERQEVIRDQAKRCKVAIAYVNMVGGQDELVFDGQSMMVNAAGKIIERAKGFKEDMLISDFNILPAKVKRSSRSILIAKELHQQAKAPIVKKDIFRLEPAEEVYRALVLGLRDYVLKNGFQKVVLGLSGGIDSSLVAALAVDALGKENVSGVFMPTRYSSKDSEVDARELAVNLEIQFKVVSIEQLYKIYLLILEPHFAGEEKNIAEENLQARIRGNVLMALSNKFNWLVLTTGNKSEMSTGYATLYGDMAGGLAVIKDVPKTLVYKLSRYRNSLNFVIPERVLTKEPTAELKPNQKDSDSLPAYDTLDPILKSYVEEDQDAAAIIAQGFDKNAVLRVLNLVDKSEYKRRQSPPGIKITPKAFGRDRRMPITNKYKG